MTAEPEYLPADALAEDEPKYLRRQKPIEIRRRKFNRKTLPLYRRILVAGVLTLAGGLAVYQAVHYFLDSPGVELRSPDQIEIIGSRYLPRAAVLDIFSADMGRSVVRVPLDQRRKALESLTWVERAEVQRVLPNHIRVEIIERTPVAFLRTGNNLSLVDAHGVILQRPLQGIFHFPVINGIGRSMPLNQRAQRTGLFARFMNEIEQAQPGADDHVSEVDLSNATDLRVTLTGLGAGPGKASPVLVHFGNTDFGDRYHLLAANIDQWRANSGPVESVDLRFADQVVVNPEASAVAANTATGAPAVGRRQR